jgi:hypothetical protein
MMDLRNHSRGSWITYRQKNIGRNKGKSNAKFAITPHRRSKVMVKQIRKRNNWKLGGTHKAFHK